ncbi:alpha/beta hydrolase [Sporosarcina sp. NCCP-2716]|uniref:alpha/beta hydrolase n=1 Tax=Sporosarcina sp. NCCP-2716 TaxID=2943679 RepID=UPI00203ACED5|nr:alpha/beta hydrolase [Sporosarcina sp. NCCP-2716]GKV68537.1 alpha/beta hydrolase [Sporosarcina sp. NCCP-2716]
MKRKIWAATILVVIVLLAGLIFAGNYFYDQGIKRGTEVKLHSEPEGVNDLASDEDRALLKEANDWYAGQDKNTITMKSYDNLKLKAQFIKNKENPDHQAVILVHGFRNTGDDMGKYAKFYYDRGFDILLPDARGHGQSEGDYIGYGWHERLDMKDWITYLIQQHDAEEIILQGNSMGAATVLMTSGETLPDQVKGIVADSSYSTVKDELAHQLKSIYGLPAFPLLDVTSVIAKIRAGYTLQEASAVDQVRKNTKPLLLIHGDKDDLVPTDMADILYKAAGGDKELWIVEDAGHTKAYDNRTTEYEGKLSDFLDRALD